MPNEIFVLLLLAVAVLALVDVFLGGSVGFGRAGVAGRLGWCEFATRPLPLLLFGLGAALLPARPLAGAALLLLAAGLALAGRRCACQQA